MSRNEQFDTGAVFGRTRPALHPMTIAPWWSKNEGVKRVKLSTLTATQETLNPDKVNQLIREPSDEPITVARTGNNQSWLYDGHHRAAAAIARGEKTILAKVHRI